MPVVAYRPTLTEPATLGLIFDLCSCLHIQHKLNVEQQVLSPPVQLSPAMRCHALILLLPGTLAFQFPFKVPFFNKQTIRADVVRELPVAGTPRIAIIGAGAGGSSAAFWISKAKERFGLDIDVDVYEREAYIGGRTSKILTSTPHSITLTHGMYRKHRCLPI